MIVHGAKHPHHSRPGKDAIYHAGCKRAPSSGVLPARRAAPSRQVTHRLAQHRCGLTDYFYFSRIAAGLGCRCHKESSPERSTRLIVIKPFITADTLAAQQCPDKNASNKVPRAITLVLAIIFQQIVQTRQGDAFVQCQLRNSRSGYRNL